MFRNMWKKWLNRLLNRFMGIRISNLPPATLPLTGNEIAPIVQNGNTVNFPISAVAIDDSNFAKLDENNEFTGTNTFTSLSVGSLSGIENVLFGYTAPVNASPGEAILDPAIPARGRWVLIHSRRRRVEKSPLSNLQ